MVSRRLALVAGLALACSKSDPAPGPLGMNLGLDGKLYAGAASIDITPEVVETYLDHDGDGSFGGCLDDPTGTECGTGDGFDDVDGDGYFDAVFIGGFGPYRPAQGVHDPITCRAIVLAQDGHYIALVSLDLVGLGSPRIHAARDQLLLEGFHRDAMIAVSTHNHQGPDTMGLWGNPLASPPVSGMNPDYQQRVTEAIVDAVTAAAGSMEPVELAVGAVRMRDRSPWFSGEVFGGKNPTAKMHGMIYDGRDPVLASDQLLVMQGRAAGGGGAVFTLTNWSGHPEVWGSGNALLSSDWVGVTRDVLEGAYGGVAVHMPESLGGMQSALNGDLPLVDEQGHGVYQACSGEAVTDPDDADCYGLVEGDPRVDADGDPVPEWAERDSWDFVRSHGWHIADAAVDVLDGAQTYTEANIRVEAEHLHVPIFNVIYQLLGPAGIFDLGLEDAVTDLDLCPEANDAEMGCIATRTFRARVGPVGFLAVPGELLPELAWGFPDDAAWELEAAQPTARGEGATYFPQHDADCNELDYAACTVEDEIGDCDCLAVHAWPYRLSDDPEVGPMFDAFDDEYTAVLSMADNYMSYIVPEPDFNTWVSLLSDDGDHYEDTVSPGLKFATRVQEAQAAIEARWD